jgi:hypothetical protein
MSSQTTWLAHDRPAASSEICATHEDIAALAYALWQEQGRPDGTQEENWLKAELQLTAKALRL